MPNRLINLHASSTSSRRQFAGAGTNTPQPDARRGERPAPGNNPPLTAAKSLCPCHCAFTPPGSGTTPPRTGTPPPRRRPRPQPRSSHAPYHPLRLAHHAPVDPMPPTLRQRPIRPLQNHNNLEITPAGISHAQLPPHHKANLPARFRVGMTNGSATFTAMPWLSPFFRQAKLVSNRRRNAILGRSRAEKYRGECTRPSRGGEGGPAVIRRHRRRWP